MSSFKTPTTEVLNLSQYIYDRLSSVAPVEAIKMQKLLYYCKAWSLATSGEALFRDEIQAWKHGPVVSSLYPRHRGKVVLDTWEVGDSTKLTDSEKLMADTVMNVYGGFSGWELRNLTHTETPWIDAWAKSGQGKQQNYPILDKSMADFYRAKLNG